MRDDARGPRWEAPRMLRLLLPGRCEARCPRIEEVEGDDEGYRARGIRTLSLLAGEVTHSAVGVARRGPALKGPSLTEPTCVAPRPCTYTCQTGRFRQGLLSGKRTASTSSCHAHKNAYLGKDVLGPLVKTGRLALAFV